MGFIYHQVGEWGRNAYIRHIGEEQGMVDDEDVGIFRPPFGQVKRALLLQAIFRLTNAVFTTETRQGRAVPGVRRLI